MRTYLLFAYIYKIIKKFWVSYTEYIMSKFEGTKLAEINQRIRRKLREIRAAEEKLKHSKKSNNNKTV